MPALGRAEHEGMQPFVPEIAPSTMDRLLRIARQATGMRPGAGMSRLLARRIRRRLAALALGSCEDYCELLAAGDEREWRFFIDAVATGETYFFRGAGLWRRFAEQVIPALVDEKRRAGNRSLRLWSAASSNGAEAYTLALVLRHAAPVLEGWDIQIVGTDISARAIEAARAARYDAYAVGRVPAELLRRYFVADACGALYQVCDEIRRRVRFAQHDLREPFAANEFDVVLLRNVLMYFDRSTSRRVLRSVMSAVRPGGYLVTGDADPAQWSEAAGSLVYREGLSRTWECIAPFIYRASGMAAPLPGATPAGVTTF